MVLTEVYRTQYCRSQLNWGLGHRVASELSDEEFLIVVAAVRWLDDVDCLVDLGHSLFVGAASGLHERPRRTPCLFQLDEELARPSEF